MRYDEPACQHHSWWQVFLPDRGAWFFVYLLFGMLFLRPELLLWDGGSCRHIINGLMMLRDHAIPMTNYASAIFPDSECFTRAWLSDLISGAFYQQFHLKGVVFICSFVIVLGLTWSYQMGRARGLGVLSGLIMLSIVMATVGMHWSARSHIYSYLPFLSVYYLVFMTCGHGGFTRSGQTIAAETTGTQTVASQNTVALGLGRATLIGLSMCLWANLHGSFLIGVAMIGFKTVCDLVTILRKRTPDSISWLTSDLLALAAAVIGTCVNPRSFSFYSHVAGYLSNPLIVHRTDEWRAFDMFAGIGSPAFLVLLGIVFTLIWKSRKVPSFGEIAFFVALVIAGFESMRLIPYCALLAMPIAGPSWAALKQRYLADAATTITTASEADNESRPVDHADTTTKTTDVPAETSTTGTSSSGNKEQAPATSKAASNTEKPTLLAKIALVESKAEAQEPSGIKLGIASVALTVIFAVVMLTASYFDLNDFDEERLPVKAVQYMHDHNIKGLGFNYDNWGGYLYFKTNRRVFIDDWADFLPVQFVDDYLDMLTAKGDWQNKFNKYNFQWVLVPGESQLAQLLAQSPRWKTAYKDKVSVLLVPNQQEPAH